LEEKLSRNATVKIYLIAIIGIFLGVFIFTKISETSYGIFCIVFLVVAFWIVREMIDDIMRVEKGKNTICSLGKCPEHLDRFHVFISIKYSETPYHAKAIVQAEAITIAQRCSSRTEFVQEFDQYILQLNNYFKNIKKERVAKEIQEFNAIFRESAV
jgi:hypothetical protein